MTPEPTAEPTPTPTPTPSPTLEPTPRADARAAARRRGRGRRPVRSVLRASPCALGPGRYAPMRFEPAISFKLGDGWSAATNDQRLVVLSRDEGFMTLREPCRRPGRPGGEGRGLARGSSSTRSRDRKGVSATKPAQRPDREAPRPLGRCDAERVGRVAHLHGRRDRPTSWSPAARRGSSRSTSTEQVLVIVIEPAEGRDAANDPRDRGRRGREHPPALTVDGAGAAPGDDLGGNGTSGAVWWPYRTIDDLASDRRGLPRCTQRPSSAATAWRVEARAARRLFDDAHVLLAIAIAVAGTIIEPSRRPGCWSSWIAGSACVYVVGPARARRLASLRLAADPTAARRGRVRLRVSASSSARRRPADAPSTCRS